MDLYAENILEHYKNPLHRGCMAHSSVTRTENNPSCGDSIILSLQIKEDVITQVRWDGEGCAVSMAAMSMLSEKLAGMSVQEAQTLNAQDIVKLLRVPISARRMKCALLCLHSLKNALHAQRKEPAQSWTETIGQNNGSNEK
ncbi:MAG: iron-sulfur cluster assembly scaffold protein [Candidatus Peribacteraceae bacterium]|jgi:nitrogen fixation NifU-like protein